MNKKYLKSAYLMGAAGEKTAWSDQFTSMEIEEFCYGFAACRMAHVRPSDM